jgi:Rogdi leucine zipper containing protein
MANELNWLLNEIKDEIHTSVLTGLEECQERLCQRHSGFKLVVSTPKSDALIGIVTRYGTELTECDLTVKLNTVNRGQPFNLRFKSHKSFSLLQTVDTVNLISGIVDGLTERLKPSSQLHTTRGGELLLRQMQISLSLIQEALLRLDEPPSSSVYPLHATDINLFEELPTGLAVDFYTKDSSVLTDIRSIRDTEEMSNPLGTLTSVFGTKRKASKTVFYGTKSVCELERVTVASQDPNLISLASKLTAVEKQLEIMKRKLELCLQVTREEERDP